MFAWECVWPSIKLGRKCASAGGLLGAPSGSIGGCCDFMPHVYAHMRQWNPEEVRRCELSVYVCVCVRVVCDKVSRTERVRTRRLIQMLSGISARGTFVIVIPCYSLTRFCARRYCQYETVWDSSLDTMSCEYIERRLRDIAYTRRTNRLDHIRPVKRLITSVQC